MEYRISTTVLLLWHVAGLSQEKPKEIGMLDTAVRIHISIKTKTQHQHTEQLFYRQKCRDTIWLCSSRRRSPCVRVLRACGTFINENVHSPPSPHRKLEKNLVQQADSEAASHVWHTKTTRSKMRIFLNASAQEVHEFELSWGRIWRSN